jgi:glycosyltransferase 2 family protein
VVVVLYLAKPGQLLKILRLADYRLVILAAAGAVLWLLVRALAWRTLLQNKATYSQVFFTVNEGYLLNNILPFRLGEVARALLLSQKASLSFWEVFPTIVIERILDLAFAVGLFLSTLPFVAVSMIGADRARQLAFVTGMVVFAGLIGLYLLARNRAWAVAQYHRLARRWPIFSKIGGQSVETFFTGLSVLTDARLFILACFYIFLNWMIALGQYYLFMRAFIPDAHFLWAAFTLGAAALGFAAPSSPGAVGVYEAVVVGALAVFGIPADIALAFALVAHLTQYIITSVLGAIGLARDGESLLGLYNRLRRVSLKPAATGVEERVE